MSKNGITIGKFMPLHKGHELLISFGAEVLTNFTILVSGSESDIIPLWVRYEWVKEFVRVKDYKNVEVIKHFDNSPTPVNIDANGTVLDIEYQQYWVNEFNFYGDYDLTHFVSSDNYGEIMAKLLHLTWLPLDPLRKQYSISGTELRNYMYDQYEVFELISPIARPYFVKTVAIVGPESTGKSTLLDCFNDFAYEAVPEYGRVLSEAYNNKLTSEDFMNIAKGQVALVNYAKNNTTKPLVISDSDLFSTYLFSEVYLGEKIEKLKDMSLEHTFDFYIVLAPTMPFVNDGWRLTSDKKVRDRFFNKTIEYLTKNKLNYVVIDETTWEKRVRAANKALNDYMIGISYEL